MEEAFGVKLFHRSKNKIELNDTGKAALEQAEILLAQAEESIQRVRTFERSRRTITVHSCAPAPLWSLLPELSHRFPENIISSELTGIDEIIQNIISGRADIGILPHACQHKDISCIPYIQEQLFVCIPKGHALADKPELSLSQLNGFNCLIRDKIGFWTELVKQKMPASRFLTQANEFEFEELVRTSTLLCFSSSKATYLNHALKERNQIPLTDAEVNVTYHLISLVKSTIWVHEY